MQYLLYKDSVLENVHANNYIKVVVLYNQIASKFRTLACFIHAMLIYSQMFGITIGTFVPRHRLESEKPMCS